ncbi:hypothetical protein ACROYT_G014880 [Oculina patagonica]
MKGVKDRQDFILLAPELQIRSATVEVYGIDFLAAGGNTDHKTVAGYLVVTKPARQMQLILPPEVFSQKNSLAINCGGGGGMEHLGPVIKRPSVLLWDEIDENTLEKMAKQPAGPQIMYDTSSLSEMDRNKGHSDKSVAPFELNEKNYSSLEKRVRRRHQSYKYFDFSE